ncbi:MAG: M15 family metallopeptidase [Flavobacteriales bacterium]
MKRLLQGGVLGITLWFFFLACDNAAEKQNSNIQEKVEEESKPYKPKKDQKTTNLPAQLVDVQSINPDIQIDLKYRTTDNFLKQRLYFSIDRAYLQQDVATRLAKVQNALTKLKPGYHLLIFDALRPVSVQEKMWNALDTIVPVERAKFVSNPKNRSLHNFGAAVDLSITDENGKLLDMGAGFDDIRKIAYPCLEDSFSRAGLLTTQQLSNRLLLRKLMQSQGFRQLPTEWWHYNACSRVEAKQKYQEVLQEP